MFIRGYYRYEPFKVRMQWYLDQTERIRVICQVVSLPDVGRSPHDGQQSVRMVGQRSFRNAHSCSYCRHNR